MYNLHEQNNKGAGSHISQLCLIPCDNLYILGKLRFFLIFLANMRTETTQHTILIAAPLAFAEHVL